MANGSMASSNRPFIKVTWEEWVPWTIVVPQDDGSVKIRGPMGHVLDLLSKHLQFDYELVRSAEKVWGNPDKNGNWDGMLGMLQREEAEITLGPSSITFQRETICDMSVPLAGANKELMMPRPTLKTDMSGFLQAFTPEVWLLTVLSMVAISCATVLLVWAEGRIFGRAVRSIFAQTVMWVLKAFTQEGSKWLPRQDGGRVLVATWLLASLVFMSSYSGILTAMLTLPRVTIPIDSLADLVAQDELPWKVEGGTSLHQYFKEAKSGIPLQVAKGLSGTFKDCWEAKQEVVDGKYVAICDDTTIIKVMAWDFSKTGDCHIYMARESVIASVWMGVAFRRNSSYLRPANKLIRKLTEAGLVQYWLSKEIGSVPQCLRPPTADRSDGIAAINLEAFGGPLLVMAAGSLLASVVFMLELLVWRLSATEEQ